MELKIKVGGGGRVNVTKEFFVCEIDKKVGVGVGSGWLDGNQE